MKNIDEDYYYHYVFLSSDRFGDKSIIKVCINKLENDGVELKASIFDDVECLISALFKSVKTNPPLHPFSRLFSGLNAIANGTMIYKGAEVANRVLDLSEQAWFEEDDDEINLIKRKFECDIYGYSLCDNYGDSLLRFHTENLFQILYSSKINSINKISNKMHELKNSNCLMQIIVDFNPLYVDRDGEINYPLVFNGLIFRFCDALDPCKEYISINVDSKSSISFAKDFIETFKNK